MAIVQGLFVNSTLVDDLGVHGTLNLIMQYDTTKTVANLISDIATLQGLIVPLTNGGWVRNEMVLNLGTPPGGSATPTTDADAEFGGTWDWGNSVTPFAYGIRIPAIKDSIISGSRINRSNTDVIAWEAAAIAAGTNGTQLIDREYRVLLGPKYTFLDVRKARRALHSKSKDVR